MALSLECDGCGGKIPIDTPPIGRLAGVYYCGDCRAIYLDTDAAIDRVQSRLATTYEAERGNLLAAARKALKRLPDE